MIATYISFSNQTFVGACVVEHLETEFALDVAYRLGIVPHFTSIMGVPDSIENMEKGFPRKHWGKLMSRADMKAAGIVVDEIEIPIDRPPFDPTRN